MHDNNELDDAELAVCGGDFGPGWLPAAPYRQHLRTVISDTGLPWRAVALYLGVPARFARRLAGQRPPRRVPAALGVRLLAADTEELMALAGTPGRRRLTSRRVRWLTEQGFDPDAIATMLEVSRGDAERLARDRGWCSARTELLARAAVQAHSSRNPALIAPAEAA